MIVSRLGSWAEYNPRDDRNMMGAFSLLNTIKIDQAVKLAMSAESDTGRRTKQEKLISYANHAVSNVPWFWDLLKMEKEIAIPIKNFKLKNCTPSAIASLTSWTT